MINFECKIEDGKVSCKSNMTNSLSKLSDINKKLDALLNNINKNNRENFDTLSNVSPARSNNTSSK